MKKSLLVLGLFCLAIVLSLFDLGCKKLDVVKLDAFQNRDKLLQNKDFQAYVLNLQTSLTRITDVKEWAKALNTKVTESQQATVAKFAGYESAADYSAFWKTQNELLDKVKEKFDFSNINSAMKTELGKDITTWVSQHPKQNIENYVPNTALSLKPLNKYLVAEDSGPNVCDVNRLLCNTASQGLLIVDIAICTSSLEAGGVAGAAALALYPYCLTMAGLTYSSHIKNCTTNFNNCNAIIKKDLAD